MKRLPASPATRERLAALFDGTAEVEDVKGALEGEVSDALGRGYYEPGACPGSGYRNGTRRARLKTAKGAIESGAPQVSHRAEPFRSKVREILKGRTAEPERLCSPSTSFLVIQAEIRGN